MSTTDRAAFEQYAESQGCRDFEYDQDDSQRYRNPFTQREYKYWRAALDWQAATEAAKATGTAAQESAPAELPQSECGACHGSGWVVRDADIGTEQECFSCGGSGIDEESPASPQPVAKVLTPEQAWKVISKALGYSDSNRGRTMLIEFLEEAGAIADAILAAQAQHTDG